MNLEAYAVLSVVIGLAGTVACGSSQLGSEGNPPAPANSPPVACTSNATQPLTVRIELQDDSSGKCQVAWIAPDYLKACVGDKIFWMVFNSCTDNPTKKNVAIVKIHPKYPLHQGNDSDNPLDTCSLSVAVDNNGGSGSFPSPSPCPIRADARVGLYKYDIGGGVTKDPEIDVQPGSDERSRRKQ